MEGDPPRRTGKTTLSDDELILLDALFEYPTRRDSMKKEDMLQRHLPYEHGLEGDALEQTIRRLEEEKIVQTVPGESGGAYLELTEKGVRLWEEERAPDWNSFCCWTTVGEDEEYEYDEGMTAELVVEGEERTRKQGRIKEGEEQFYFVVRSPSAETARACLEARIECGFEDAFLSRSFTRIFLNRRLLPWKAFPKVYECWAPYNPESNNSDEDPEENADWETYERKCTWWSQVRDLCDFPPGLTIRLDDPTAGDRELEAEVRSLAGYADRVREASLRETRITDAGLMLLLPFRKLRDLSLGNTLVTDRGLEACAVFKELEAINLMRTRITDAGIAALAGLKELRMLWLNHTLVGDGALEILAGLPRLEVLFLNGTKVTGAGLAAVSRMARLETLGLAGTMFRDSEMRRLAAFVGLRTLDLARTGVTDAGLAQLAALPKLENLHLSGTAVTDAGITRLASFPALSGLFLDDTGITDAALGHLAGLRRLSWLSLKRTAVTDAGIEKLRGLEGLHVLSLGGARVTRTGVARLREHLTRLVISEEIGLPDTEDL
jgi:DNA-binding MarR family transcriptional regulator